MLSWIHGNRGAQRRISHRLAVPGDDRPCRSAWRKRQGEYRHLGTQRLPLLLGLLGPLPLLDPFIRREALVDCQILPIACEGGRDSAPPGLAYGESEERAGARVELLALRDGLARHPVMARLHLRHSSIEESLSGIAVL